MTKRTGITQVRIFDPTDNLDKLNSEINDYLLDHCEETATVMFTKKISVGREWYAPWREYVTVFYCCEIIIN